MTWMLVLILVLLLISGVMRAFHEAPTHDINCGVNLWASRKYKLTKPKLWRWLDSRASSDNKYLFAAGKSKLVAKLLQGPLVGFTDFWHLSHTLSNWTSNIAMVLALRLGPVGWLLCIGITFVEDCAFEPVYRTLRNYTPDYGNGEQL